MKHKPTKEIIERLFMEEPTLIIEAIEFKKRVVSGEVDKDIINALFQEHERYEDFDIYTAHVLKFLYNLYEIGLMGVARIEIGDTPYKNNMVEKNNEALSRISSIYEARFLPSSGANDDNDDGYFKVKDEGLTIEFKNGPSIEVNNLYVPLEVGTTSVHTTFKHLRRYQGLARWSYHSNQIILLFINIEWEEISKEKIKLIKGKEIVKSNIIVQDVKDSKSLLKALLDINSEIERQKIPTNLYFFYGYKKGVGIINFEGFEINDFNDSGSVSVIKCISNHGIAEYHWVIPNSGNLVISKNIDSSGDYDFLAITIGIN